MIEYVRTDTGQYENGFGQWTGKIEGEPICKVIVGIVDNDWQVMAFDLTESPNKRIPGSPFESLNKAKAVIEYHYRNLL